ncbi:hypothetical protein CCAX7_003610 [Capsulimonas corticalis]|uniref:Invasin domain-containing protein n=1 Tax=Capsulimonas corticalis TaxID=2219043 RepID=A0A402CSA4_9BACT|nr:hypothetical protein CCAX7_003610 [Capsulimonas corticalis]
MRGKSRRSRISKVFRIAVGFSAVALSVHSAYAGGRTSVSLTANPSVIIADGKSTTTIAIMIRDGNGGLVPDGTEVHLVTSQGILDKETVTTVSGVARAVLTSSASESMATVTATCILGGDSGVGNANLPVEFTADRTLASSGGESRWIRIDCAEYLVYSADGKIVEADGKHGSAHLHYHGVTINADAIQIDLQSLQLLARNAVMTQNKHTLTAAQLKFDLNSMSGKGVVSDAKRGPHEVTISGLGFDTADIRSGDAAVGAPPPIPGGDASAPAPDEYAFLDLSQSRVVITARAIAVDQGSQLQFRRASIYSDGKKVLSVPFHMMPLTTDQLFGEQIVGYGSQGLFLNVPYYYSVSPTSTGTIYLRNSAIAGASLQTSVPTYSGINGSRPGVSLDLQQTYSMGAGGQGSLIMNSLTRSDWGAHWQHTQQIDSLTNSNFYIDSPAHRSIFGASNVSHRFKDFSLNFSANANQDPGQDGYSSSGTSLNTYLQTNAREIGATGINFVSTASWQSGQSNYTIPNSSKVTQSLDTEGLDMRFYTAPIHFGKDTSLSNSLTVGQTWSRGASQTSPTLLGTLGLQRVMPMHGRLNVNYTYRYDPLLSHYSDSTLAGLYNQAASQHRMNIGYSATPSKKLLMSFSTNLGWPQNTTNLFSTVSYKYNDDWQLGLSTFYSKYFTGSYNATELSLTRRVFNRSIVFTYSTDTHKVRFDFGAGTF